MLGKKAGKHDVQVVIQKLTFFGCPSWKSRKNLWKKGHSHHPKKGHKECLLYLCFVRELCLVDFRLSWWKFIATHCPEERKAPLSCLTWQWLIPIWEIPLMAEILHQLRLVVHPIKKQGFIHPRWVFARFLPSTIPREWSVNKTVNA